MWTGPHGQWKQIFLTSAGEQMLVIILQQRKDPNIQNRAHVIKKVENGRESS